MRNPLSRFPVACLLAAGVCGVVPLRAEETVRADRTPLTHRDSGLYTNMKFWHGRPPEADGVGSMLTPERAATPEAPWAFYISQGPGPADLIRRMAASGKRLILRLSLGGHTGPAPSVDEMEQRLVEQLQGIDPGWLYAITLDEERVYWNGWAQALAELYGRCKQRWPDLPVYQWWTPMEVPNVRAASGWVALPADGWIIDLYGQPRESFEKKVVQALETGKPLIHIVWSSPEWLGHSGGRDWTEGRRIFDDQLDVCRGYNVPVAHFCTQAAVKSEGRPGEPIRWGWHAVSPVVRDWYREIEILAENLRLLPDTAVGFRSLDARVFDWAHAWIERPTIAFALDEAERKTVTVSPAIDRIPLKAGEHAVPAGAADRFFEVTCRLDDSLKDLQPGFGLSGVAGRTASSTLLFKIVPRVPLAGLSAAADAYAQSALGGAAELSVSRDGVTWSEPVRTQPGKPTRHRLAAPAPGDGAQADRFDRNPLWVRVKLGVSAGKVTNKATALNRLDISAAVAPRLDGAE